eukprot:69740-Rhodomonas_salina.1
MKRTSGKSEAHTQQSGSNPGGSIRCIRNGYRAAGAYAEGELYQALRSLTRRFEVVVGKLKTTSTNPSSCSCNISIGFVASSSSSSLRLLPVRTGSVSILFLKLSRKKAGIAYDDLRSLRRPEMSKTTSAQSLQL